MSPTEQMREAFERYFLESRKSKGANRRPTFARHPDDTYTDDHTQRHWWTWQNAQAALTAPAAEPEQSTRLRGGVPEGWKLVPVEPTPEMQSAALPYVMRQHQTRSIWAAMLSARPLPAPPAQRGEG